MPSSIKNSYVPITEINKLLIFCHTFFIIFVWSFLCYFPFSFYHHFCIYCCLVAKSCLTLCNPMAQEAPLSIHRIFQARILDWVAISFSRGSSWPRYQTQVSSFAGEFFNAKPPGKSPTHTLSVYIPLKNALKRAADCKSEGEIAENVWEQELKMEVAHKV